VTENITPYDLFKNLRLTCPNNFQFNTKAIPDLLWQSVNVFGLLPNFVGVPAIGPCENLPIFTDAESVVRFIYAMVTTPNPIDIPANYQKLKAIRDKAIEKLTYPDAARDVINNPVLDVGIYLLDDKIDNLPPADNLLDALTKIEDLLPKDLRDAYSTYVLYVTTQTKKELAKQAREEQRRSKMKETSPEFTTFEPLIQEAVDYCRSVVKPKPNAPEFPSVSPEIVWRSLSPKLASAGITSIDVSKIDVHTIDCTDIYNTAYSYASRAPPNARNLLMYNRTASLLADALYSLIVSKSTTTVTPKEKVEAEEKRYEELRRKEETELEIANELLDELYSHLVGKPTSIGIPIDQIPDFLSTYLSILNQAGLSPKDYTTLEEMFATFLELLQEANIPPSQYKEILNKVIVLPPEVQKSVAKSVLQILSDYAKGTISASQAADTILSLIGKPAQPTTTPPPPPPPKPTPQVKPSPKPAPPTKPPTSYPQWINELVPYNIYILANSKPQFIRYFVNYDVKKAIIFAYDDALIAVPNIKVSKTRKVMVFYSPDYTKLFVRGAESFAGGYKGYGSFSPYFYGPVVGAESSLGKVVDEQNIEFIFNVPVVRIEKFTYSYVEYITKLPGINVCLMYINNGSVFGVLENCAIDEEPGTILHMTPNGLETFERRIPF
jgi:hypothetical protein